MRIYPADASFYPATLLGKTVYICDFRLHPESLTDWFYYEARHDDDGNFIDPVTIEHRVLVNFCCSVLSKEALLSEGETYIDASGIDIDYNTTLSYADLTSADNDTDSGTDLCANCWNDDCKSSNSNTPEKQAICKDLRDVDLSDSYVEPDFWDDRTYSV